MNTRKYAKRQEQTLAQMLNAKRQANSGATPFQKGDVKTKKFLIECKTCIEPKKSFTIKKEWLTKNKEEAFAMGREYGVLAFNFGPGESNYFVLDERTFKDLIGRIENVG